MRALITGGCGFIGSAAVRILVGAGHQVLNIDKLTYAGDPRTVAAVAGSPNYRFEKMDILDQSGIAASFRDFAPQAVFHLAAETHVDRSIDDPGKFIDTNIRRTFVLLHTAPRCLREWRGCRKLQYRRARRDQQHRPRGSYMYAS